ncbi:phosphoadenylyl-sulfate reductase [Sphingomonas sp. ASV193]|uniref:phosphoadenylyl-sulfate reductase n=1 Tax=Sphingomonas sp. ASV193 TaxID=3144405 RepID=UPI0032E91F6B
MAIAAACDIADRLRHAIATIDGPLVFTTSFGIEDQLIAHHLFTDDLPIRVVALDTGRLFDRTYALWQETEERYGRRIAAVYPRSDALSALVADQGINGFYRSTGARAACCATRKVEPLARALSGAGGWVVGLRADQSATRAATTLTQWDEAHRLTKVAPLFDYDRARVVRECVALGVPVNPLHAEGFLSIGCAPCTRAIRPGEPERAGRWWWEADQARECGLHLADGRLVRRASA